MSQTLYLERNLGWEGLLIEPDTRSLKDILKIRSSWVASVCIDPDAPLMVRKNHSFNLIYDNF